VQYTDDKVRIGVDHFTTRPYAPAQGSQVGQQDKALLVERLVGYKVGYFEQGHSPSPKYNQTSVGHVGTQQLAG
jgi:hypothetical protein